MEIGKADPDANALYELFKDTKLYYLKEIIKYNLLGEGQKRFLIITSDEIFNYKKQTRKWSIGIDKLVAITKNIAAKNSEFILHVESSHDYRYEELERKKIIKILKELFFHLYEKNLPIYGIVESNLSQHVRSEKMKDRSLPKIENRLFNEDLYFEGTTPSLDMRFSDFILLYCTPSRSKENILDGMKVKASKLLSHDNEVEYEVTTKKNEALVMKIIGKCNYFDPKSVSADFLVFEAGKTQDSPFIIHPEFVYVTNEALYIFHKFIYVTNIGSILVSQKRFNERRVKFYGHQIVSALLHLHSKGIVYGNLRPENILVDKEGYVCLNYYDTYCFLTPDSKEKYIATVIAKEPQYLAPECFLNKDITFASDWWALGVLLYEMSTGVDPFHDTNVMNYGSNIISKPVEFPSPVKSHILLSDDIRDLINKLLSKVITKRIGDSVVKHPFFSVRQWTDEEIMNKTVDKSFFVSVDGKFEDPVKLLYSLK